MTEVGTRRLTKPPGPLPENDLKLYERSERRTRFGVDCPDKVTWKVWKPGGEYVVVVGLTNCLPKLQVLEYRLPKQKATFFLDFPEPITLSSGMDCKIKVRFRPTKLVPFHDALEIVTSTGSFHIRFEALVPYMAISHAQSHDFGLCPVKVNTPFKFPLKNIGTLPLNFTWEVPIGHAGRPLPFEITPERGSLAPDQSAVMTMSFHPEQASVFVAAVVCRYGEGNDATSIVEVSGVGKYPFVRAVGGPVDFGEVFVGLKDDRKITLKNQSQVPAAFKIHRKDNTTTTVDPFAFHPSSDIVPPDSSKTIKVSYSPLSCGLHSLNDYVVKVIGAPDITISVQGIGVGPELQVSTKQVHFGEINIDTYVKPKEKVVKLTNASTRECVYQFMQMESGPSGAFRATPMQGVIGGKKTVNVTLYFAPEEPANYYRRVYILAMGSASPLWIDLMGGAFTEKSRPPQFAFKHVQQMRARGKVGLGRISPEEIEDLMQDKSGLNASEDVSAAKEALGLAMEPPAFTNKAAFLDILKRSSDADDVPFCLDEAQLDFGSVRTRSGESRSVSVLNNTASKATAFWCVSQDAPFTVDPISADIPPFGGTPFTVRAKPPSHEHPSNKQFILECYVLFKTMRSFRLVSNDLVVPPSCLLLQCGSSGTDRLCPVRAALSQTAIEFPPVHASDTVFQTIALSNKGDTPFTFSVQLSTPKCKADVEAREQQLAQEGQPYPLQHQNSVSELGLTGNELRKEAIFEVFPEKGMVCGGMTQVLLLKFRAEKPSLYTCKGEILLDESQYRSLQLSMTGTGYTPSLVLRNDATVYFKNTLIGSATVRQYAIENPSRIPVAFHWEIPKKHASVFQIEPMDGVLKGNERRNIKMRFLPDKNRKYVVQIPVVCMSQNDKHDTGVTQSLTMVGEGTTGELTLEPLEVTIETVRAGDAVKRDLSLFNSSPSEVWYTLGWKLTGDDPIASDEISIEPNTGYVPVRAHKTVQLTFSPKRKGKYSFTIYCKTIKEAEAWGPATEPPADLSSYPTCCVTGTGGYPTVEITDVKCTAVSKSHLWQQISVDQVNEVLKSDVTATDLDTRQFEFSTMCRTYPSLPVSFGSAVHNSPTTKLYLTFENISEIPVQFQFVFPNDSEFPIEKWYHEEVPTDEDLAREEVLDNNLFCVEPKVGFVAPHNSVTLMFSYKRKMTGTHKLPVLLKIAKGKRVILNFFGTTLSEEEHHLDILLATHRFAPVAIGDANPPMQYYELRNTSHVPVCYELSAEPFSQMCQNAYDFPIFQCLNSYGEIPPNSSAMLQWYFRPLEAKVYSMTVPIMVQDGAACTVEFIGEGFHPKKVTSEEMDAMKAVEFTKVNQFPTLEKIPAFPVVLSQDVLSFGRVSAHSLHRQLLILRSTHNTDNFSFAWDTYMQHGEQIIEVSPKEGVIPPNGLAICKLTVYTGSVSHIIEQSLQCKIVNSDLQARRMQHRAAHEEQASLALEPTEDDMQSTQSPSRPTVMTSNSLSGFKGKRNRLPITQPPPKYQTTTQLKQTIERLLDAADPENMDENAPELHWVDAPEAIIDVRLQARVMGLEAFKTSEPELWERQYLPTLAVYQQVCGKEKE